jgi:hypothetical protein
MQKSIALIAVFLFACFVGCKSNVPPASDSDMIPLDQLPTNSVFRVYDSSMVDTINRRWNGLLKGATPNKTGVVTLQWRLLPNGEINNLRVVRSTIGDEYNRLAEKTILDLTPFPAWPAAMQLICTNGYRDIHLDLFVP